MAGSKAKEEAELNALLPDTETEDKAPQWHHRKKHDARCRICKAAKRREIEKWFVCWRSMEEIEQQFNCEPETQKKHAMACGLYIRRMRNTKYAYAKILEQGMSKLQHQDVTPKEMIQLLNWVDKLEGRVVEKHHHDGAPRTINFISVPLPGGIENKDVKELKAAIVKEPLLLPGKVIEEKLAKSPRTKPQRAPKASDEDLAE